MNQSMPTISADELSRRIATPDAPLVFDVRRREAFDASPYVSPGARWRDHRLAAQWGGDIPPDREVVVYCVHGHQVSRSTVAALESAGVAARLLDGGIECYSDAGGPTAGRPITEIIAWLLPRPVDLGAAACAWLVRRFIDPLASLHFADREWSEAIATELEAERIGLPDTALATIEPLAERMTIHDRAIGRIGALLSVEPDPGAEPTLGIHYAYAGLAGITPSPHRLVERAAVLFDGVYAALRERNSQ